MKKKSLRRPLSNKGILLLSKGVSPRTQQFDVSLMRLATTIAQQKPSSRPKPSPPDLFTRYARNQFEKAAALFYSQYPPAPLQSCNDSVKAEFLFRCFYCGIFANILVRWFANQNKGVAPLWLNESASYLIALERTHLELVLSMSTMHENSLLDLTWTKPHRVGDFAELPKPTVKWFLNPPGDLNFWRSRFETWHKAASKSFRYWLSASCRDIDNPSPVLANAASAGAIIHKSPLLPGFMDDLVQHFQARHRDAINMFYKNAASPEAIFHGDMELNCWLIEIWPLVTKQKWNYQKISEFARKRFDRNKKGNSVYRSGIEARCDKLKLKLHESLRAGGRPRKSTIQTHRDPFELMAIWIESVGMKKNAWLTGQRDFAAK